MTLVVFGGQGNKKLYAFIIFAFIINQIVTIVYGIVTGQLGFILSVVFQLFLLILTHIYVSNTMQKLEKDEYENL
jgi:uncharacterized membrane protein